MPDHITDIGKKELYSSFLNNKPIRTLKNEGKEWFLFKDILLALGYSRSTAESGSSYQSLVVPESEKTRFLTALEESPRKRNDALFVSQKGAESFIRDCGKGKTVSQMKIVSSGGDTAPTLQTAEEIAYSEELVEKILNNPEIFISLLRAYQQERSVRRQKEEALNNIMNIIAAA